MLTYDYDTKKSIREAFGNELLEIGKKNHNVVVLDADLSASTQTKIFAKAFPERFFNVGIAEQNLINTAVGLSFEGKIPFVATFAVFATGRTYDQIRMSVAYQNANVKIIGTHCGITVGEDGATHQALEDISLMRGLPNMVIISPADCNECRAALNFALNHHGPVYIRVPRNNVADIYPENHMINIDKATLLKTGSDVTLLSNGDLLQNVLKASEILSKNGVNAEILSTPMIKPFDKEPLLASASKTKLVVSVENHSIYGGLGSTVAEILSENLPTKLSRIGMNDTFGQSGNPDELLKFYNMDAVSIANKVMKLL